MDYCSLADLNKALSGDVPVDGTEWDGVKAGIITAVSSEFDREIAAARGISAPWSLVADTNATQRLFTGRPGPTSLLPIDDCIAVTAVTCGGRTLVSGTDFYPWPLNGQTYTGLLRTNGAGWNLSVAGNLVTAKWGMFATVPEDARQAAIAESAREFLAGRAGFNDTIGLTAFGSVVTSKAFTSKSWQLISTYSFGGGIFR